MAHYNCSICDFDVSELASCPACDAAEAIIFSGAAHPNYHELLAEQIGNLLASRDWQRVIELNKMFPRYA